MAEEADTFSGMIKVVSKLWEDTPWKADHSGKIQSLRKRYGFQNSGAGWTRRPGLPRCREFDAILSRSLQRQGRWRSCRAGDLSERCWNMWTGGS